MSSLSEINPKFAMYAIGLPCLILTVVSSASILPLTINIQIENSYLKLLWRNITMVPFLAVFSYIEYRYLPKKKQETYYSSLMKEKKLILITGLSLLVMQVTYLMAGERTVMAHATIFTNLTPFMLVMLRIIMR